jgi:hypothetical protein
MKDVRTAGAPAEIRTCHIRNTSVERYHKANPLAKILIYSAIYVIIYRRIIRMSMNVHTSVLHVLLSVVSSV